MYAGGHKSSAAGKRTLASDRIGPSGTSELAVIHSITDRVEFARLLHTGDTAFPEAVCAALEERRDVAGGRSVAFVAGGEA